MWRSDRGLNRLMCGSHVKSLAGFVLIIHLCCIMLWRSVFTIHLFFCSFCPCSAAAGCQENQGLSLCLQHTLCAQHRVTFSVLCSFRHLAIPLHHYNLLSYEPPKGSDIFPAVPPFPVNHPHMFPYKHCKTMTSDLFVQLCQTERVWCAPCSATNPTTPGCP